MKNVLLLLIFGLIYSSAYSQNEEIAGTFEQKSKRESGEVVEIVLKLTSDGTFECSFYQDQICYKESKKGKGTWTLINDEIRFSASLEKDVNDDYSMNFNETTAKIKGDTLIFIKSNMIWPLRVSLTRSASYKHVNQH